MDTVPTAAPALVTLGAPVIVAVAAFVALWKYKADIMKVIGVCALVGLIYSAAL